MYKLRSIQVKILERLKCIGIFREIQVSDLSCDRVPPLAIGIYTTTTLSIVGGMYIYSLCDILQIRMSYNMYKYRCPGVYHIKFIL
jgi:hypothetical protein